mmetsp:Transcript_82493/g.260426  ORF Transcript_82493/g.260426 Transcript_82493/m.260426 type:complete len:204 (+) Transcript_82493:266-877(+)
MLQRLGSGRVDPDAQQWERRRRSIPSMTRCSCLPSTRQWQPRRRRQSRQAVACGSNKCRGLQGPLRIQLRTPVPTRRTRAWMTRASSPTSRPGCRASPARTPETRRPLGSAARDGPSRRPSRRMRRIPNRHPPAPIPSRTRRPTPPRPPPPAAGSAPSAPPRVPTARMPGRLRGGPGTPAPPRPRARSRNSGTLVTSAWTPGS